MRCEQTLTLLCKWSVAVGICLHVTAESGDVLR